MSLAYAQPVPHATPKEQGTAVEAAVLAAVDGLGLVPDPVVEWCDAIAVDAVAPRPGLESVGLPVVERGTRVEIKGAQVARSNGTRESPGQWYVTRRAHEALLSRGGVYLLAVYQPGDGVVTALLAPANVVDDVLAGRWYDVAGSRCEQEAAQVAWPTLIEREAVDGGGAGGK